MWGTAALAFTSPSIFHGRTSSARVISPKLSLRTTRQSRLQFSTRCSLQNHNFAIGLNQYTHDAAVAVIDTSTGEILFAASKERLTRKKHDGGDLDLVIRHALSVVAASLHLTLEQCASSVRLVVANNHHHRITPFESRLPFQVSLNYVSPSALSAWNLIATSFPFVENRLAPKATKVELSHHLAHAYSAVFGAPFHRGLVIIMDGMGDSMDEWMRARSEDSTDSGEYFTEESLPNSVCKDSDNFREFPQDVGRRAGVTFREAETAYVFERNPLNAAEVKFTRVFKRWTPENAPSELVNHSFEDMDSVGALYSRVSSIIFKDWNVCGKVMGLAPYGQAGFKDENGRTFMTGHLIDGSLQVRNGKLKGMDHLETSYRNAVEDKQMREYFQNLSYGIQNDLEEVVLDFVGALVSQTGETDVVFAGGVALNSSLNGKLSTSGFVRRLYVPPYPGDEGISIGCAYFGLTRVATTNDPSVAIAPPRTWRATTFLGKEYSEEDIEDALTAFMPWIDVERGVSVGHVAAALFDGKVVGWFRGRSEFGPRALGSRSLIADPRHKEMATVMNAKVKRREAFRPFAPAVLAEEAEQWFEQSEGHTFPFMSETRVAALPDKIAAVVHVDDTARLQTVSEEDNAEFYAVIKRFGEMSGVPMVMNTSFNTAGEPIVETPYDALLAFLDLDGIDVLSFQGVMVTRKEVDRERWEEGLVVRAACGSYRSELTQDEFGNIVRVTVSYQCERGGFNLGHLMSAEDEVAPDIGVICVELDDELELEILQAVYQCRQCPVTELMTLFVDGTEDAVADVNAARNTQQAGDADQVSGQDVWDRLIRLFEMRLVQLHDGS